MTENGILSIINSFRGIEEGCDTRKRWFASRHFTFVEIGESWMETLSRLHEEKKSLM